jgi:hypothetical protein
MPHKQVPTRFSTKDIADTGFFEWPSEREIRAGAKRLKAIKECPPELIGTSLDPVFADGSPVKTARRNARDMKAHPTEVKRARRRQMPIQIASFEV